MTRSEPDTGRPAETRPPSSVPRRAAGFPIAEEALPRDEVRSGPYRLTFAHTLEELRALQRLRFEVFNLELGEGLASSFESGLDQDDLDEVMHHLLISDARNGEVVGTYRMQTAAMAATNGGFYTAGEFDLSGLPLGIIEDAVEVGRACIAKAHRTRRVLHLLWRGLAVYLTRTRKHLLFGCCSLTTQDGQVGNEVHARLVQGGHLHPDDGTGLAAPRPGVRTARRGKRRQEGPQDPAPIPELPEPGLQDLRTPRHRPGIQDHRLSGRARRAPAGAPCLPWLLRVVRWRRQARFHHVSGRGSGPWWRSGRSPSSPGPP